MIGLGFALLGVDSLCKMLILQLEILTWSCFAISTILSSMFSLFF